MSTALRPPAKRRILGLDPGLRHTGWGMVETQGNRLTYLDSGTATSDAAAPLYLRLSQLEEALVHAIQRWQPHETAVEKIFVNKNAASSLKLGHAQAVCMLVAARHGNKVVEYDPNTVKKAVTGFGHAQKQQVESMVKTLLPQSSPNSQHAADALATAICHAQHGNLATVLERQAL